MTALIGAPYTITPSYRRYSTGSVGGVGPRPRLGHQWSPSSAVIAEAGMERRVERVVIWSGVSLACEWEKGGG